MELFITKIAVLLLEETGEHHRHVVHLCKGLATGRWCSPVSSTNKTECHDILVNEILLNVALNVIILPLSPKTANQNTLSNACADLLFSCNMQFDWSIKVLMEMFNVLHPSHGQLWSTLLITFVRITNSVYM